MEKHLDFDLVLSRAERAPRTERPVGDGEMDADAVHYVCHLASPVGSAQHQFALPFQPFEVENFALKLGHRRGVRSFESAGSAEAREFGERLFDAVFTGQVNLNYRRSLDEAQRTSRNLRVRLRLEDQELATIPWEFMFDPTKDSFLALSKHTPLVRVLDVPFQKHPTEIGLPLRILVMVSSPSDYAKLDVEAEYQRLASAMADRIRAGQVDMVRVNGSVAELQSAFRRNTFHAFHFIGHGGFDHNSQDGVLLLEDSSGSAEVMSGSKLATLLQDEPTLQLAVLNACEGGRGSQQDPFAGVAQSMIRKGMPAVVAMQFEITDMAAITLSRDFYGALSDGLAVDAALAEARKAVFASGDGVEWGTPVLYLQSNAQLFTIQPSRLVPFADTGQLPQMNPTAPAQHNTGQIPITTPQPQTHHNTGQIPITTPQPQTYHNTGQGQIQDEAVLSPSERTADPSGAVRAFIMAVVGAALVAVMVLGAIWLAQSRQSETAIDPPATVDAVTAPLALEPTATAAPTPVPTATTQPTATPIPIRPVETTSNEVFVRRVDTPPLIDGLDTDWQIADFQRTSSVIHSDGWDQQPDGGAWFAFTHDAEHLYVLVTVIDDVHDQQFDGENMLRGDSINLSFASSLSAELSGPAAGDMQLTMGMVNGERPAVHWWTGDGTSFSKPLGDRTLVDLEFREAGGSDFIGREYVLEASIPKSALPFEPSLILASVTDSDGEQAQTVIYSHLAQDSSLVDGTTRPFESPNLWGALTFE